VAPVPGMIILSLTKYMLCKEKGVINLVSLKSHTNIKSLVHVALSCVVSGKGSIILGLMHIVFPCISTRGCFQGLTHDLMVIRKQLYRCTRSSLQKGSDKVVANSSQYLLIVRILL
jgi:hypothetical protein